MLMMLLLLEIHLPRNTLSLLVELPPGPMQLCRIRLSSSLSCQKLRVGPLERRMKGSDFRVELGVERGSGRRGLGRGRSG